MSLTKKKYDSKNKTYFSHEGENKEVIEKLGYIEHLIEKYGLEGETQKETLMNVKRCFALGTIAIKRVQRATNQKVYIISGRRVIKAFLKGFVGEEEHPEYVVVEKKGNQTVLPYNEIYISRREAKLEKKGLQYYSLDKKLYDKVFKDEAYRADTYFIEVKKNTDVFKICTRVFKGYWIVRKNRTFSISELKELFNIDIDKEFKSERIKHKEEMKKLSDN